MGSKNTDSLLIFFNELLESEKEREIVSMIFEDKNKEQIIEKLIDMLKKEGGSKND